MHIASGAEPIQTDPINHRSAIVRVTHNWAYSVFVESFHDETMNLDSPYNCFSSFTESTVWGKVLFQASKSKRIQMIGEKGSEDGTAFAVSLSTATHAWRGCDRSKVGMNSQVW